MGYRLSGAPIAPIGPADLPSEAACPGAVQIPDAGTPIVLMPDGPTVGGYPKLAVVRQADLGRLAQCVPGAVVRFRLDS
jgi:allophanate hydrolase subunit 2